MAACGHEYVIVRQCVGQEHAAARGQRIVIAVAEVEIGAALLARGDLVPAMQTLAEAARVPEVFLAAAIRSVHRGEPPLLQGP